MQPAHFQVDFKWTNREMEDRLKEIGQKIDVQMVLTQHLRSIDATLEKWIPRKLNEEELIKIAGPQRYSCDYEALNTVLFQPIWELLDRGGKKWRSTLLLLVAEALGKKADDVLDFVVITEIVHNGSLIIDDIEDESDFRRGKPCLHKMMGVDVAINAGNFMYFLPLRMLREYRGKLSAETILKCYELYSQDLVNLHLGQGLDISWHGSKSQAIEEPNEANYLQMCANKTGGLARLSAKLSAVICGASDAQIEAVGNFAESIGVAFQIQDDILNLVEDSQLSAGKGGAGEDIHEGKRTLMVIHVFNTGSPEHAARLKEILAMKTSDAALIKEAIGILKANNGIEYAKSVAEDLVKKAWSDIDKLLPATEAKQKLKALTEFMIQRSV